MRTAFERAFRPLVGLRDFDRLGSIIGEYGTRALLAAFEKARTRPAGSPRIHDPFQWLRKVLACGVSPPQGQKPPRLTLDDKLPDLAKKRYELEQMSPEERKRKDAETARKLYLASGGDIYGIFGED